MTTGKAKFMIVFGSVALVCLVGWSTILYSYNPAEKNKTKPDTQVPIILDHRGSAPALERPPVVFSHDRHTRALKQAKGEDCGICHRLTQTDAAFMKSEVRVYKFPKEPFDETDKTQIMHAYHTACVSCHRKMAGEGVKTGPDVGMCGKCHVKGAAQEKTAWKWTPLFTYSRHAKHVDGLKKVDIPKHLNILPKIEVIGTITDENKTCLACHHTYREPQKKLVYEKNTENGCRACHKAQDDKNARSLKHVAHAACIGCHLQLAERSGKPLVTLAAQNEEKRGVGPFECSGCHGEHKELSPEEIQAIPRLVRGQKDMMDLSLVPLEPSGQVSAKPLSGDGAPSIRMKVVPFNHKAHEPRTQFCSSCHHYSLEKCVNCHTPGGDQKKGQGVSYERAFHKVGSRQSCLGCHAEAKQDQKCAGCHQWMPDGNGVTSSAFCAVCHRGPSQGKVVDAPKVPPFQDKEKVPEKLQIKLLEKEFKPADFQHLKIVNKLLSISNESSLARFFHAATEQVLCSGCHHRSQLPEAAAKVPSCRACHTRPFAPDALGKPGILAAYHRQCMGCHQAMNQKPAPGECEKCHPAKDSSMRAGMIPPVSVAK